MIVLTSEQATASGWTLTRSESGLPRFIDPEGRLYARAAEGAKPDVVIGGHPLRWVMRTDALLACMVQGYTQRVRRV